MNIVLFAQVRRYKSLKFLPPTQYNEGECSFICVIISITQMQNQFPETCSHTVEKDEINK